MIKKPFDPLSLQSLSLDRRTAVAGAVALSMAAGAPEASAQANPRPRSYDLIGKPAPPTDLARFGGGRLTNADFRGKTTIVQFWGIWCPDCLADVDDVAELNRLIAGDRKLRFVGVHTRGRYGRWGNLATFFAEKGYSFPVAIDDDSAAYRDWGIKWVPSFVIIGRNGVVQDYTTDLKAGSGIGVEGLIAKARAVSRLRS